MTQEEQLKAFEQALEDAWKHYRESGAAIVDALEENMQELAFAKGFNAGYKQSVEHPTGGELLYVLNKGVKQGYKDAVEKTCEWLKDNVEIYFDIDGNEPIMDVADLLKDFERDMEEQQ